MAKYTASKRNIWIKRAILFSIFLVLAIGVSLVAGYLFVEYFQPSPVSTQAEKKTSGVTETVSSIELEEYEKIVKEETEIYKGPLILVNNQNLYLLQCQRLHHKKCCPGNDPAAGPEQGLCPPQFRFARCFGHAGQPGIAPSFWFW